MDISKLMSERCPLNGTFELTGRCNLKCKMCLVRVDQNAIMTSGLKERTTREWIQMAEAAKEAGTVGLLLTGGEIMMRTDFCEIYEAIAQMGFILSIYTNATMVTDAIMATLKKYPPHKIGVTMYGASNATYDQLCSCPDGYDRFLEGIEKLSTLPSLLDVRTTIVKDNYSDLKQMQQFVKQRFGEDKVLHISRMVVNTVHGGVACPSTCRLSPEQNVEIVYSGFFDLYRKIKKGEVILQAQNDASLKMFRNKPIEEGSYLFEQCSAGIKEYSINWAGHMYACELLNGGYTKPFEDGFETAWKLLPEQYPSTKRIKDCEACQYAALCEACPAARLAETGDWFGIPVYACQEAAAIYNLLDEMKVLE